MIGTGQLMEYGLIEDYDKEYPRKTSKPGTVLTFPGGRGIENE